MINFPSYHAAVAVFVPWALRGIEGVFPAACVANVIMFASAITEGGHYVCDVFAGAAIAAVAFILAEKITRPGFPENGDTNRSDVENAAALPQTMLT
ncbi:phosphatase PAP2 family protein [Tardiphaga sp.]|jgi:hypothetical protein|uniref:phosphatase PAP2 family protein n=1 Tax=Tardiphaga sp. TaxID=1926292 RepID=UPI0037DA61D0